MYGSKIQKPQRPIPFYNNTAKKYQNQKQDMYGSSNIQNSQKPKSRNLKKPIPETSKTHFAFCKQQMRFFCNFYFYFSHKLKPVMYDI